MNTRVALILAAGLVVTSYINAYQYIVVFMRGSRKRETPLCFVVMGLLLQSLLSEIHCLPVD